jgi:DNA-3-methyladenine glycosylase
MILASSLERESAFDGNFFERHPLQVAFDLLGSTFVVDRDNTTVAARIVEVEAYGGMEDLASHATMYRVGRQALTSAPGVLYMQQSYGLHTMTNIVAHVAGGLGAVLLRAAEDPIVGFELAKERRAPKTQSLLMGPGCFSQGLGMRLSDTLLPLTIETGIMVIPGPPVNEVRATSRIGISRATEALWRLFDGNSRQVSKHRRGEVINRCDLAKLIAQLPVK